MQRNQQEIQTVQQNEQDIRNGDTLYHQERKRLKQSLLQNWMIQKKHHKKNCSQYERRITLFYGSKQF